MRNAVITADTDTELGLLCSEYPDIADLVEPESVDALVGGILRSLRRSKPNLVAKKYASENIDKDKVLSAFEAELHALLG